jgi:hypothetical protein
MLKRWRFTENVPLLLNAYKTNHWKENSERITICHRKKPHVTRRNLHSKRPAQIFLCFKMLTKSLRML